MGQGERKLDGLEPSVQEVQGHPDLGAEAGGNTRQRIQGRGEQGALARERFGGGVAGAARDLAPGVILDQAEASAGSGRKSGDGNMAPPFQGPQQHPQFSGGGAKIRVGEQDRLRAVAAGVDEPGEQGPAFSGGTTGRPGAQDFGAQVTGDFRGRVPAPVVHDYEVGEIRQGLKGLGEPFVLVMGRYYDYGPERHAASL